MSDPNTPNKRSNADEDNTPLADDEEYQQIEEDTEIDENGNELKQDGTQEGETYPDWVSGKREHTHHRRHKRRIKVQKKIKVKKKTNKKKYKKVIERIIWTLIIIGFVTSMIILIKELDIVDQNAKKKKKVMINTLPDSEIAFQVAAIKTNNTGYNS